MLIEPESIRRGFWVAVAWLTVSSKLSAGNFRPMHFIETILPSGDCFVGYAELSSK